MATIINCSAEECSYNMDRMCQNTEITLEADGGGLFDCNEYYEEDEQDETG